MSAVSHSVAMTGEIDAQARAHLLRRDRQEDVCFAIWYPSTGARRTTALIHRLILPEPGDRNVHGNASFEPRYFERALAQAAGAGGGLALLHSHPDGVGWQGMSADDVSAEYGHAAATFGATKHPLLGLTLAGDAAWSARAWMRTAPRVYTRQFCGTVRVIGGHLAITYMDELCPPPPHTDQQIRTISAWGEKAQADMIRLRIGVIGGGSVGGMVAEALARTGFTDVVLIDFDHIEPRNLDRLVYATSNDVGKRKVDVLREHMLNAATARRISIEAIPKAVYEEDAFRKALDCDVLFSCVDRPWGRHVLNYLAYVHLIPVVDGGIAVRTNRRGQLAGADWRAHVAAPGRPCLQCLGQYSTSLVQMEREGQLDDPTYIDGLPRDHILKSSENVFAFSMACASLQVLQMLNMVLAPSGLSNPGAQLYHFVGGYMEEPQFGHCDDECMFNELVGQGDTCRFPVTGIRVPIENVDPPVQHPEVLAAGKLAQWLSNATSRLRMLFAGGSRS